jgi:hypothetical protein
MLIWPQVQTRLVQTFAMFLKTKNPKLASQLSHDIGQSKNRTNDGHHTAGLSDGTGSRHSACGVTKNNRSGEGTATAPFHDHCALFMQARSGHTVVDSKSTPCRTEILRDEIMLIQHQERLFHCAKHHSNRRCGGARQWWSADCGKPHRPGTLTANRASEAQHSWPRTSEGGALFAFRADCG